MGNVQAPTMLHGSKTFILRPGGIDHGSTCIIKLAVCLDDGKTYVVKIMKDLPAQFRMSEVNRNLNESDVVIPEEIMEIDLEIKK